MTKYVLGFAFNDEKDYVVLIEKNKPAWQKGNLNGVGGKIESGEMPLTAMVREFQEETGMKTNPMKWKLVGKMGGDGWECHVFTIVDDALMEADTTTDESIMVLPVADVLNGNYAFITNVPFLIELCRDRARPKFVTIEY